MSTLIVVATPGEAQALSDLEQRGHCRVVVSGVGPVAAALATWRAATSQVSLPELVVSAGIGGSYPGSGLQTGDAAVSSQIIQADLGAWDGDQFLPLADLGLSIHPTRTQFPSFAAWAGAADLAQQAGARLGPMLTVNTTTGSQATAQALARQFPGALTEGMEGAGVAHAALLLGVPVLEVRGVSNPVGPRDRAAWNIPGAMQAARRVLDILK